MKKIPGLLLLMILLAVFAGCQKSAPANISEVNAHVIDGGDPAWQVGSFLLGGGAALIAHAGKAGARALVNASPEPFSNIAVSTGEDVATAGLLGLAIANPIAAALIAIILVILSIWLVLSARRLLKRVLEPKRRQAG